MGAFGGILAVLGVVVLPITSGDTAFRVGRLILADYFRVPQSRIANRYLFAVPLFGLSLSLNFVDFDIIWRYFGWANQALAAVALWCGAVFLARRRSRWWLAALPAVFMTVVTTSYILIEDVGFGMNPARHATRVGSRGGGLAGFWLDADCCAAIASVYLTSLSVAAIVTCGRTARAWLVCGAHLRNL